MSEAPEKKILISKEVQRFRDCIGTVSPIKVADMLGTPLHEIQREIASYFEAPLIHTWDTAVWLLSRRLGKSYLGFKIAESLMLTPESRILVVCHSTSLADVWFKEVLSHLLSIPAIKDKVVWGKKEGTIEIPELNTSFICCSYLNAQARSIGKAFNFLVFDEAFLVPPLDFEELMSLITPTTANYGSNDGIKYAKKIILSTPRGSATGSLQGLTYLKGVNGDKGHLSFKYDIYSSPFLTEEEIEHIRLTTDKDSFNQEFLVKFTTSSRTAFRNFDKKKHIIPLSESFLKDMAHKCDIICAIDLGIVDGNGASCILYNNSTDTYYIFDEYYKKDEVSYDFIKNMKKKMEDWCLKLEIPFNQVIWFYDASALESAKVANQYFNLTMNKARNKQTEGVDFVNKMLQGKGDAQIPQLYFKDSCIIHAEMFEYCEFKVTAGIITNQFAKDPTQRKSHYELCATTIYGTYTHNKTSHSSFIIS